MNYIDNLVNSYPALECVKDAVKLATDSILTSYRKGGKILVAGNGGSAADSEHIAGEMLKGFLLRRHPSESEMAALTEHLSSEEAAMLQRGVPTIPLPSISATLSAFANDVCPELVFAQLTFALGRPGDVLIALSTSGNSKNVVKAAEVAKAMGLTVIALTGEGGGKLRALADVTIMAPVRETYKVQEYHLPIYHAICAEVESTLFD